MSARHLDPQPTMSYYLVHNVNQPPEETNEKFQKQNNTRSDKKYKYIIHLSTPSASFYPISKCPSIPLSSPPLSLSVENVCNFILRKTQQYYAYENSTTRLVITYHVSFVQSTITSGHHCGRGRGGEGVGHAA